MLIFFIHITVNERPQLKDINNTVVIKYAMNWKQLGRNLKIDDNLLNIIEKDNPHDSESCCSKMLSEWLDLTPNASWKMLYNAMDKKEDELSEIPDVVEKLNAAVDDLPNAVEKLNTMVYNLPAVIDKLDIKADTLPDTVDKLGNAAATLPDTVEKLDRTVNKLPKAVDQLCEAVNELSKPVGSLHIAENISFDKFTGIVVALLINGNMHTYVQNYHMLANLQSRQLQNLSVYQHTEQKFVMLGIHVICMFCAYYV